MNLFSMGAVKTSWVEDLVFSEYCNCSPSGDYWYCFWLQRWRCTIAGW